MKTSTFKLELKILRRVRVGTSDLDREEFSRWLWNRYREAGLLGIHEGTLLTDEAVRQGLETETWTVDSGEAPRERDWVSGQDSLTSELYFSNVEVAERAARELEDCEGLAVAAVFEQKPEDWDAIWKASFLNSKDGVLIPPFWRIMPPWLEAAPNPGNPRERVLRINPGAGFGTGTHETTQLCLQAIAGNLLGDGGRGSVARVLDFGSGSGILAIASALLGASVDAVEIDPLAIDNAVDNARLNQVEGMIRFSKDLSPLAAGSQYDLVTANILRPVLMEFAANLVGRLRPGGVLVLSGLIQGDVDEVSLRYSGLLGRGITPEVLELAEWRALVWSGDMARRKGEDELQ